MAEPTNPSLAGRCVGCGDCCAAITCNTTKVFLRAQLADPDSSVENRENAEFMLKHWRRITKAEAHRLQPYLEVFNDQPIIFWRCDAFDYTTRRCTAYDARPPICRDFPWYTYGPNTYGLAGLPRCGYWVDVPEEQRPVGVPIAFEAFDEIRR